MISCHLGPDHSLVKGFFFHSFVTSVSSVITSTLGFLVFGNSILSFVIINSSEFILLKLQIKVDDVSSGYLDLRS